MQTTEFGIALKRFRRMQRMTQVELARKVYVVPDTIREYECGRRYPLENTGIRISKALGVSLDDLHLDYNVKEGKRGSRMARRHNGQYAHSLRIERGMSVRQLAKKADVGVTTIYDMENGRRNTSDRIWDKVMAVFREEEDVKVS